MTLCCLRLLVFFFSSFHLSYCGHNITALLYNITSLLYNITALLYNITSLLYIAGLQVDQFLGQPLQHQHHLLVLLLQQWHLLHRKLHCLAQLVLDPLYLVLLLQSRLCLPPAAAQLVLVLCVNSQTFLAFR
jgi:hypothetical protein